MVRMEYERASCNHETFNSTAHPHQSAQKGTLKPQNIPNNHSQPNGVLQMGKLRLEVGEGAVQFGLLAPSLRPLPFSF